MKYPSPIQVVPRSAALMLLGATRYPTQHVKQVLTLEDGRQYQVFREIVMRANPPQADGGVFRVWFRPKMSVPQTIQFSLLTKLGFVGMPGFRGKMWLVNPDLGEFGGIYQFNTVENAERYQASFAMRFSRWRSQPGMFATEVYAKAGDDSLLRAQTKPLASSVPTPNMPGLNVTR